MWEQGICRLSSSPWASPIHLVLKKKVMENLWRLLQVKRSNGTRSLSYCPHTWFRWSSPWKENLYHSGSRSSISSDPNGWRGLYKKLHSPLHSGFSSLAWCLSVWGMPRKLSRDSWTRSSETWTSSTAASITLSCQSAEHHPEHLHIVLSRLQHVLSININKCCLGHSEVQ
jgi:hypothetical protein